MIQTGHLVNGRQNTYGFQNLQQVLDLFCGDSWPNVDGGKLEVRPPAAPTTDPTDWLGCYLSALPASDRDWQVLVSRVLARATVGVSVQQSA